MADLFQHFTAWINLGGGAAGCAPQDFGQNSRWKGWKSLKEFWEVPGEQFGPDNFLGVTCFTQNNQQLFQFQRVPYTGREGKHAQPGAGKDPSQNK